MLSVECRDVDVEMNPINEGKQMIIKTNASDSVQSNHISLELKTGTRNKVMPSKIGDLEVNGEETANLKSRTTAAATQVQTHTSHASPLKVASVVGFYIFSSIAMIMVNKAVLNQSGLPLFFLWGQLVIAVIILKLASIAGLLRLPPVSFALLKSISSLIAINVVGLVLNTLCLQHIDAVMYQVARSLILPITVAMTPILHKQRVSAQVVFCCIITSVGFIVGIFGERTFAVSTTGIIFGVLSSLTTSLHSFVIKNSFKNTQHNGAFDLVYYNNLFSAIFLAPILLLEVRQLNQFVDNGGWPVTKVFLIGTLIAGATGLLINLAGFLQIKVTSPVTHTVSSAARGVLQTLAARLFLGEAITVARSVGIGITLLGSCAYSVVKTRENALVHSAPKSTDYTKLETSEK